MPLVGAVVGALAGGVDVAAAHVLPHAVAAALALGTLAILTGGIHLDGFLDACDALFASVPPERRLEILKDPRHGTFAVVGMFVAGIVWYAALAALAPARAPLLLAFACALARAAAVPNAFRFPYALGGAVTRAFAARPSAGALAATFVVLLAVAFAVWPPLVVSIPLAVAASLLLGAWCARRLGGGLVGDAYGFVIVVVEIALVVGLAWAGARAG